MEYISSYYRSEEGGQALSCGEDNILCSRASVVLQQVRCGSLPVLFAWVCGERAAAETEWAAERTGTDKESAYTEEDSAGAYMTGRLLDWFYKKALGLCKRGLWPKMKAAEKSLMGEIAEIEEELALWKAGKGGRGLDSVTGILCVGSSFLLCSRGHQRTYAMNTRFLRPNLRLLTGESTSWQIRRGILQPGIGIVLGTESFYRGLTEEMVRECLEIEALSEVLRLEKRLQELGETENGNGRMEGKGAVLFCTRQTIF